VKTDGASPFATLYERTFLQSQVSTQILDKDGGCIRVNPAFTLIFGVEPEQLEGKAYNVFDDENWRACGALPLLEGVFRDSKTAEWELELAGGAFRGVGIPNCIESGERAVTKVLADLGITYDEDTAPPARAH